MYMYYMQEIYYGRHECNGDVRHRMEKTIKQMEEYMKNNALQNIQMEEYIKYGARPDKYSTLY